jgi:hypothetical protein
MRLQKHHRQAVDAVRNLCPGMQASMQPARKHPKLEASYEGIVIRITVASSPARPEDVVRRSVTDIVSRFASLGVILQPAQR